MYKAPVDYKGLSGYTIEELHKEALLQLLDHIGSYTKLSGMLGVTSVSIYNWVKAGRMGKQGAVRVLTHPELKELELAYYLRLDLSSKDIIEIDTINGHRENIFERCRVARERKQLKMEY